MKDKRNLTPRTLGSDSRIARARKLAEASPPLIADLYLAHLQACATNRDGETKRRRRKKSASH